MNDAQRTNDSEHHDSLSDRFHRFAHRISIVVGNPWTFGLAILLIVVWLVTGPIFGFSDTWQLVINTSTTIVTFLMVFLIQNTQNRDAKALHLKLDELLRGLKGARNQLIDLEDLSDEELARLEEEFRAMREGATATPVEIENPGVRRSRATESRATASRKKKTRPASKRNARPKKPPHS